MRHDAHPEFGDNQSNAIRTMSLGPESGDSSLCKQFPFNIPQYSESQTEHLRSWSGLDETINCVEATLNFFVREVSVKSVSFIILMMMIVLSLLVILCFIMNLINWYLFIVITLIFFPVLRSSQSDLILILIGQDWLCDLDAGLWLVRSSQSDKIVIASSRHVSKY